MSKLAIISMLAYFSTIFPVDATTAISIATCESQLNKYPINWEGSSAKGLFMFTDRTWKAYCKGDVMNPKDNALCFYKLYPQHPGWWECSK